MQHAPQDADDLWQLQGHSATIDLPGIVAAVDLSSPQTGLSHIHLLGRHVRGQILGVREADTGGETVGLLAEHYVRGEDLAAVYEPTDAFPCRLTLYWRVFGGIANRSGVVVDLIVSVQTDLLDATPQLWSRSYLSDAQMMLVPSTADGFALDHEKATRHAVDTPTTRIGCAVLRLGDVDATYCEMIHPTDWRGLNVQTLGSGVELSWPLVGHFMEKGVIRRLRIRGIFFAGRADEANISGLYAQFAGSPPPLTA